MSDYRRVGEDKRLTDLADAVRALTRAKAERDARVRHCVRSGLSLRTVARVVGLSHVQVYRIVQEERSTLDRVAVVADRGVLVHGHEQMPLPLR
jgi:hypothetical protein